MDSSLFALNIKSPLCQLKCQCPISIAEMVGGRRRGRLVDAEETSNERDQQQPKPTPTSVELGVMDPGPGDALVGLTSGRRPPCRINKQALASRYTRDNNAILHVAHFRSDYFKKALQPHFNQSKDCADVHLDPVSLSDLFWSSTFHTKVSSDMVTEEAWQVLLPYLSTGVAPILSLDTVFDALRAANYLQMDEAQTQITAYVKEHVSKADFLNAYNYAKQANCKLLSGTIETTIILPEQVKIHRWT